MKESWFWNVWVNNRLPFRHIYVGQLYTIERFTFVSRSIIWYQSFISWYQGVPLKECN